jgi:lysophospholipase L1-like esterase
MSGEGGRFAGNVYSKLASDGAEDSGKQNLGWGSYRDAWNNTIREDRPEWRCHRSDSSVVNTLAATTGAAGVNLACSGAVTDNVLNSGQQGEKAQVAQLRDLVANPAYQVRTVVVSIGGNDLKFGKVMTDCTQITRKINCGTNGEQGTLTAIGPKAGSDITATLDAITTVMRQGGYADGSYNFVYQSAPNLFATSGHRYGTPDNWFGNSYGESPGVPMSNGTVDWMKEQGQPYINKVMGDAVARANNKHITFLDTTNAFSGHELSNTATQQIKTSTVSKLGYPVAATAEWVVPINSNYIAGSIANTNRQQESYHPNRFGQQALAACINQAITQGGSGVSIQAVCTASANQGPNQATVALK